MEPLEVILIYYLLGLSWLISGVVTGWLHWRGEPTVMIMWIFLNAAIWPWYVYKIIRDLRKGQTWTNFMED